MAKYLKVLAETKNLTSTNRKFRTQNHCVAEKEKSLHFLS